MRDVVIIGSGFGASVLAARLGPHADVLLLEKGDDPTGGLDPRSNGEPLNSQKNRFRQTLAPKNTTAFAELYSDRKTMNVIAGTGFGGGSNVYDGVSLRAPTESFEQKREESPPLAGLLHAHRPRSLLCKSRGAPEGAAPRVDGQPALDARDESATTSLPRAVVGSVTRPLRSSSRTTTTRTTAGGTRANASTGVRAFS